MPYRDENDRLVGGSLPGPTRLSWGPGASWEDAVRDLSIPDLIAGLKERNDPGLWDAFFAHMDSVIEGEAVAPGASLEDARMDTGNEEAAEMARQTHVDRLRERIRERLQTMRGRF